MADKPKSILVYSKQAPKLGYRLVTPLQQPLPTITKTPILPIMGGVNINVPTPVLPSQQRTPINLPMADRLINVPSPVAPVKDKSGNKKPLEWGFKGRKETDIGRIMQENEKSTNANMKKLKRGAKKNKYIADVINRLGIYNDRSVLITVNNEFKTLEGEDVPRELTGKMIGNKLGTDFLVENNMLSNDDRSFPKIYGQKESIRNSPLWQDWKTGWLRYYNELTKSQKETFDSLSNEWNGTVNQLVEVAKSL